MNEIQLTEHEIAVLETVRNQGVDYENQATIDALWKRKLLGYDRLWGMYVLTDAAKQALKEAQS